MISTANYSQKLNDAGIRPSVQRVAIYAYLCQHPVHPDIETIYADLAPDYATLSKTTVYNTLKLFEEKKLVQSIKIEDDKLRFDADISEHKHFKCLKCCKIIDIFDNKKNTPELPEGFTQSKVQTYSWGLCPDCQ